MPKPRPRKVFGNVIHQIEGRSVRFSLTKSGLTVRVLYSRHPFTIPFPKLFNVAQNQFALHLKNQAIANAQRKELLEIQRDERAAALLERG